MIPPLAHIMLVDDDEDIRLVVATLLEAAGYQVSECMSGQEALTHIPQTHPDLVLVDVMMPDMDGLTMVAQLAQQLGETRLPTVILLTAKAQAHDREPYRHPHIRGVIVKPFDPHTFVDHLVALWENGYAHPHQ